MLSLFQTDVLLNWYRFSEPLTQWSPRAWANVLIKWFEAVLSSAKTKENIKPTHLRLWGNDPVSNQVQVPQSCAWLETEMTVGLTAWEKQHNTKEHVYWRNFYPSRLILKCLKFYCVFIENVLNFCACCFGNGSEVQTWAPRKTARTRPWWPVWKLWWWFCTLM